MCYQQFLPLTSLTLTFMWIIILEVSSSSGVQNITLGYLTVDKAKGLVRGKQGRVISGAITYAVDEINSNLSLLPDININFIWNNTWDDTLISTARLTEQWSKGAVAFFGPEDSCTVEARVAAAWNLPMIAYKCADYEVSDKSLYPTFARTYPPASQVTKSIISLLKHFNWRKYTLIVGSSHKETTTAEKLIQLSEMYNITINDRKTFDEPHIALTTGNPFPGIVEETYVGTRVYVFLGELNGVVDFMTNLYDRGLLDTGDYVVIYVDHGTFDYADPLKYFKRTMDRPDQPRNLEASRSLLVITSSPATNPQYDDFLKRVNEYNEEPPFSFPNPFHIMKKISVYAAYLYDAVRLYAQALQEVLDENGNIKNGTAIIDKIRDRSYTSIQGFLSHIDENGDAEGNYTLLSRAWFESFYANYSMMPVGHFQIEEGSGIPSFRYFEENEIDWISFKPPIDEPQCGYRAEKCIPPQTYTLEIVGGILGGLAFIIGVILLIIYRNWRYEQEIAGLLWKISISDIKTGDEPGTGHLDRNKSGSRGTLCSQQSMESKFSVTQIYARTGSYKGQVVALKMYEAKTFDVSRKMKKEMKLMRDLRHDNVNAFIGACIDPPYFIIITEYCSKGSLQDILENSDLKLDDMFLASLVKDLLQGMIFLHDSVLMIHGNLKSSNCVVNSRWMLQITDFGLLNVRAATYRKEDEHAYYRNLLWKAPEFIRYPQQKASQRGDVFSFGIILHEIYGRMGPYGCYNLSPKEIVERLGVKCNDPPFRPDIHSLNCDKYIIDCMEACWSESSIDRPDFRTVWIRLKPLRAGMKRNIFDNMMAMMEKYQENLEELVGERTEQLIEEKKKTEALLHRMLPRSVSEQLKRGEAVIPESFNSTTIYFSDICSFTKLSAESTPMQIVSMLNDLYTLFDNIIKNYDVYKIETIGDAYMVVSGLPIRNGDNHAGEIASMSLHLLTAIKTFQIPHRPDATLKLRIGIHTGSCVAGVVGMTMPRYTLFGDTVNTASRMESNGEALKIHCSAECRSILIKLGGYTLEERGLVNMKGKGDLLTYWLVSEDVQIRKQRMMVTGKVDSESGSLRRRLLSVNHKRITDTNPKYIDVSSGIEKNRSEGNLWDILKVSENKSDNCDSQSMHTRVSSFRDNRNSKDKMCDTTPSLRNHLLVPDRNGHQWRLSRSESMCGQNDNNTSAETDCLLCKTNPSISPIDKIGRRCSVDFELRVIET
ncbi:receptor-type guanylate cyclase Gyc76C [Patella vulgata]|uniref:receptor-type guanylate cyclase Gyc76C n=1 Tax=Patella vulgata TaxID=6465 RepID=UPI00217FF308|nr:receptor-type guanylate cyclase Gyc76C [Patella vulgata]